MMGRYRHWNVGLDSVWSVGWSQCLLLARSLAGWLSGWMVGWLAGWLAGCLAGWVTQSGCLAGWVTGWLAGWFGGWMACWLDGWLVLWLARWLVGWLAGRLVGWLMGWTSLRLRAGPNSKCWCTTSFLWEKCREARLGVETPVGETPVPQGREQEVKNGRKKNCAGFHCCKPERSTQAYWLKTKLMPITCQSGSDN